MRQQACTRAVLAIFICLLVAFPPNPASAQQVAVASYPQLKQALAGAPASPTLEIVVSQNVTLAGLLTVSTAGEVTITGAAAGPTGGPPALLCRSDAARAFLVRQGRLVLRNLILDGCQAPAVAASGPRTSLELDQLVVARSQGAPAPGSPQPGVVDVTDGAGVWLSGCTFRENNATLLLRVDMLPTSNVTVVDTVFARNTAARLVALDNTRPFAFDNATLHAYTADTAALWDPNYDVTEGSMATASFTRTSFLHNTLLQAGSALTANGTRVRLLDCALGSNSGFGSLLKVDSGAILLNRCRLSHNVGAAGGQPALLTLLRGAALSALLGTTITHNSRTAAVHHHGYSHWYYRTKALSPEASKWTNTTLAVDPRWSVRNLNLTLQVAVYNIKQDPDNWKKLWEKRNYTFRWDVISTINTQIYLKRRHNAPLLLRATTIAHNAFLWGALVPRDTNLEAATSLFLHTTAFTNNTVAPPPRALYDPALGFQTPALVAGFHAVAIVHSCRFTANTAPHTLHLVQTDASISRCRFERNAAPPTPAAEPRSSVLHMYETRFNLTHTRLDANAAEIAVDAANASAILTDLWVTNNTVRLAVVHVQKANLLNVVGLHVEGNRATEGGIVHFDYTVYWRWNDTSFSNNTAVTSVLQLERPYNMYDSMQMFRLNFTDNVVDMRALEAGNLTEQGGGLGGAFLVTGNDLSSQWLQLKLSNLRFLRNSLLAPNAWAAIVGGGGLRTTGSLDSLVISDSAFEGNSAPAGGALHLSTPAWLTQVSFANNTAAGPGGAVGSVTAAALTVSRCTFTLNTASSGGAIAIIPTAPPAPVSSSVKAPDVIISNNTFRGNTATPLEPPPKILGDALPPVTFDGCLPGGGGVLCVQPKGDQFVRLLGNKYYDNRARWGGLLYVNDMYYRTTSVQLAVLLCGGLAANSSGSSATEPWGGQVVYIQTGLQGVLEVRCPRNGGSGGCTNPGDFVASTANVGCSWWAADNPAAELATGPATMQMVAGVLSDATPTIRSGATINATMRFSDAFGREIIPLPPFPITVDVQPDNARSLVIFGRRGDPAAVPPGTGTASFSEIYLQPNLYSPNNTVYRLTLQINTSYPMATALSVTIRACNIGERLTDTRSCLPCLNNTFSGDPALGSCAPCPSGGDCGAGMLLPKPGWWHSSPGSPQVHRCPLSKACVHSQAALQTFIHSTASPALFRARRNATSDDPPDPATLRPVIATYRSLQCAPGHQGHLCGVCRGPDYGRFGYRCIRCLPRPLNNCLIFLAALMLATMLSFTVFSHLRSVGQYRGVPVRFRTSFTRFISRRLPGDPSRHGPPSDPSRHGPPSEDPPPLVPAAAAGPPAPPSPPASPPHAPRMATPLDSAASLAAAAAAGSGAPHCRAAAPGERDGSERSGDPGASASPGSSAGSGVVSDDDSADGGAPLLLLQRTSSTHSGASSGGASGSAAAAANGAAHAARLHGDVGADASLAAAAVGKKGRRGTSRDSDGQRDGDALVGPLAAGGTVGSAAGATSARAARRQATKAKQFLTLSKIFISYVQVVGITRNLQLEWPAVLQRLISGMDVSSSANYISLECSLGGGSLHKAITQTTIMVLLPVFAISLAALFWAGLALGGHLGYLEKAPGETAWQYFRSRMILTIVQICYYLYPLVTMAIFQIFTWTTIDAPGQDTISRQYAAAVPSYLLTGKFWTQHYDTRCFTGAHLTLTLALGIPSLVLFAAGFPLASALQLWGLRSKLDLPETVLLYGFLYEEYQPQYYAWEAVIMLRKAGLLVCTVFLRSYGDAVQLLTANMVLAVCVFLQNKHEPFQDARMNALETLSLFSTQLTLLAFGYFLPSSDATQTSQAARLTITALIAAGNLAVVAYFLLQLALAAKDWLASSASAHFFAPCLAPKADGDQPCRRPASKGTRAWPFLARRPAAAADCEAGAPHRQQLGTQAAAQPHPPQQNGMANGQNGHHAS